MSFQVSTERELIKNVYKVKISIDSVTDADKALLTANGEPPIAIGGTVTGGSDTANLPSKDAALISGFPVVQTFDGSAWIDPKDLANTWVTDVLARITAAIGVLRAAPDDFSGTTTVTI